MPAYSQASIEFSLSALCLWKLLGSKEIKVLEDVTIFLQLFVCFYPHRAKQLSCGDLSSKAKCSCLCCSAYIVVMGWPSLVRLQNRESTTSSFNRLCEPPALNAFPFNWRTSKVAQGRVWCYCSGKSWFATRLCLVKLLTFILTFFLNFLLYNFFCITMVSLVHCQLNFIFLNGQSHSDDGFTFTYSWSSNYSISQNQK